MCGETKPYTEFFTKKDGWRAVDGSRRRSRCKSCDNTIRTNRRNSNNRLARFLAKRSGAKAAGIEFTLRFEDIVWPEVCPVLGIKLDYSYGGKRSGNRYDSPSFDRIDPAIGYVPGNVIIVSHRANTIKSNATPEEIMKVATFYASLLSKSIRGRKQ